MNTSLILPNDVTPGMTIVKRGALLPEDGFIGRTDMLKVIAIRSVGDCIAFRVCSTGELIVPKDRIVRVLTQG